MLGGTVSRGRDTAHKSPVSFYEDTALKCTVSFIATFLLPLLSYLCGAVSCSCEPELPLGTTLRRIFVVQFLALVSLVLLSLTTLPVGTGRPCGMVGITHCGASPCSIELALATWCHSIK